MFGATRNTHESSAKPTVRISESTIDGPIAAMRVAAPDEQDQAREERRVDGEVDRIAGGREADRAAEQVGIGVGVDVARDVEQLADEQQRSRRGGLRAVHAHADAIAIGDESPIRLMRTA